MSQNWGNYRPSQVRRAIKAALNYEKNQAEYSELRGEYGAETGYWLGHQAAILISHAAILALASAGIELCGPPGEGRILVVNTGFWSTAFPGGAYTAPLATWVLKLGAFPVSAPILAAAALESTIPRFGGILAPATYHGTGALTGQNVTKPYDSGLDAPVTPIDQPLLLTDPAGVAYEGGDPGNRLEIQIAFQVLDLATHHFLSANESGFNPATRTFAPVAA